MNQTNARRWKSPALLAALAPLLIWGCAGASADEIAGASLQAPTVRLNAVLCGPEIPECTPFSGVVRVTSVKVSARTFTGVVGAERTPVTFKATPATVWLAAIPTDPILPAVRAWNTLIAHNPNVQIPGDPIIPSDPMFPAMLAHAGNIVKQSGGTAYFAITANRDLTLASVQPVPPPR